jgi:GrpB-like predicted nucleotidyltransferase (UPF0157 family)
MTKAELITQMAQKASLTRRHAAQVLAAFLGQIQAALRSDEPVRLVGFGSFAVRWRAARRGRHPRTGQAIIIAARRTPTFHAGKRLREAVQPASPVDIIPYNPAWPLIFEGLKVVYASALGRLALAIEHVGSTAVPGLAAKPIIDIDVVIPSRAVLGEVIPRLAALGYRHQGDLGVPGREAFTREGVDEVPRDSTGRRWPAHQLYICAADGDELRRHLLFRDWLRTHPVSLGEYGMLKAHLAQIYRDDLEGYTGAKTAFIDAALTAASASHA